MAVFALTACGFTPVYGPDGDAQELRGRIAIADPADEEGFALVKRLEDRLGQAQSSDLSLTADIRVSQNALGFLPDGEISRFNVVGQVNWQLERIDTGVVVASGVEKSFTTYSATSTTVATTFAQRDAKRRLMVILADRIVSDLISLDIP